MYFDCRRSFGVHDACKCVCVCCAGTVCAHKCVVIVACLFVIIINVLCERASGGAIECKRNESE